MDLINKTEPQIVRAGLILLFLATGLLVFYVFFFGASFLEIMIDLGLSFSLKVAIIRGIQVAVTLGSLTAALALRKNTRLRPYWRLALAYFMASCALLLSDYAGDWALTLSGQSLYTSQGLTALKLGEDAAIIGTIIALALLTRDDARELFLSKGRLGLGLVIGITSFLVFAVLGLYLTLPKGIQPDRVLELLPTLLLIVLADGFMEELLFRGLFLRRLGRLMGDRWANLVMGIIFTFMHLDVNFTAFLPMFLMIVFLLGLLWGWIMQRTGSLLAPALFHAGIDMLIIADFFVSFGIMR
jgi:membrane protease YdiL (CAAX protease family)